MRSCAIEKLVAICPTRRVGLQIRAAVCLLLGTCQLSNAADAGVAFTTGGPIPTTKLLSVDAEWRVHLDVEGRTRLVPAAELVCWGHYRDQVAKPFVLLNDGTYLVGDVVGLEDTSVRLLHTELGLLDVPRRAVRGMVFLPPPARLTRDRQFDLLAESVASMDRVHLTNGDLLSGKVSIDAGEDRNLFSIDEVVVLPPDSDRSISVPQTSITSVSVSAVGRLTRADEALMTLGLVDSTLLQIRTLRTSAEWLTLETASGVQIRALARLFWPQVSFVQPLGHGIEYLSDRAPQGFRQIPFLSGELPWQADRNVLGGRLRVGDDIFPKGIGMHPASRLTYDVPEDARDFQAEVAVDGLAFGAGSVLFRVFVARRDTDGNEGWQAAYASQVVRGGEAAVPISVDIRDATRLALIVEFADRGDELDYANWLNARILLE